MTWLAVKLAATAVVGGISYFRLDRWSSDVFARRTMSPDVRVSFDSGKAYKTTIFRTKQTFANVAFNCSLKDWYSPQARDERNAQGKFWVDTDSETFEQALASNVEVGACVRSLFDSQAREVDFDSGYLAVRVEGDHRKSPLLVDTVARLHQALKQVSLQVGPSLGDDHFANKVRALVAGMVPFGMASGLEMLTVRRGFFVDDFRGFSAVLAAVFAALAFGWWRTLSRSKRVSKFALPVLFLLAIYPATWGLIADLDQYLDFSQPVRVETMVSSASDLKTCFRPAALAGEATREAIPPCLYVGGMKIGDAVEMRIARGLLGFRWVKTLLVLEK